MVSGFHFTTYFPENVISAQSLSTKIGSVFNYYARFFVNNFNKFLSEKNRGKAFSVSSENMLHTTFCSYKKLRTSFTNNYKYKQNIDSTITFSDKKPYLAISCNCCCRQYFLWRILFNTNDLGSFFRQFGSFLKMYDIYLKMYDIYLNADTRNLNV